MHLPGVWHLGVLEEDRGACKAQARVLPPCVAIVFPCLPLFPQSEAPGGCPLAWAQHTVGAW